MPAYLLEGTCLKDPSYWRSNRNLARRRSPRVERISGPEKFGSSAKRTFQQYLPEADLFQ
jgi:hypothetical protein